MAIRDLLDSVKDIFVIGRGNSYLHGRQRRQEPRQDYLDAQEFAPQPAQGQAYQQPYPQQGYQQPAYQQAPWQQPQQPGYGQYAPQEPQYAPHPTGQQDPYVTQAANPNQRPEPPTYQTQFSPEPPREQQRNRRSQQHQESAQPQENVVPFPGAQQPQPVPETKPVDVYVVNVYNMVSCRQAVNMLRKGHCTLVVTDQLVDKAEVRHYVDILSGACFALNGSIIRLSAKVGFYVMAPQGMMVYMDSAIAGANAQLRTPQQAQPFQPPIAPPQAYQAPETVYQQPQQPVAYGYPPAPEEQARAAYMPQQANPYAYSAYAPQTQAQ